MKDARKRGRSSVPCCGGCPHWRDLKAAQAEWKAGRGPRPPATMAEFGHPGECRLRPAPVERVGYGLITWAIVEREDPGCSHHPARAKPARVGPLSGASSGTGNDSPADWIDKSLAGEPA